MRGQNLGRIRGRAFFPIDGEDEEEAASLQEALVNERKVMEKEGKEKISPTSKVSPESEFKIGDQLPPVFYVEGASENLDPIETIVAEEIPSRPVLIRGHRGGRTSWTPPKVEEERDNQEFYTYGDWKRSSRSRGSFTPSWLLEDVSDEENNGPYRYKQVSNQYKEPDQLVSKVFQVVKRFKRPITITLLLDKLLEQRVVQHNYHLYNQIIRLVKSNYLLFKRLPDGKITVRRGCRKIPRPEHLTVATPHNPETLLSLIGVIERTIKDGSTPFGTYPGLVHRQLLEMGYECSLSAVKSAMRSTKFIREGRWYKLASTSNE